MSLKEKYDRMSKDDIAEVMFREFGATEYAMCFTDGDDIACVRHTKDEGKMKALEMNSLMLAHTYMAFHDPFDFDVYTDYVTDIVAGLATSLGIVAGGKDAELLVAMYGMATRHLFGKE